MRKKTNFYREISLLIIILIFGRVVSAQTVVNSLEELLPYLDDDNVEVKLAPGTYSISGADFTAGTYSNPILLFEGNSSTYDFTDVTINFSTDLLTTINEDIHQVQIVGSNNVLLNLTMVDDGPDVKPLDGGVNLVMDGYQNRVDGFHMSIKGSYPYGYGDAFGKGANPVISHNKHSGVLMRGTENHLKDVTMIHRAYGHAIFIQGGIDTIIEGCYVEGEVRKTDEMLAETSGPAFDVGFITVWGYKIPSGFMMSLQEAGIRAYASGITTIDGEVLDRSTENPRVINCTLKNTRVGVTLTQARGTEYVEGTTTLGCERGFAIGDGSIVNCSSDIIYGKALGLDGTSSTNMTADVTILSSDEEYYNGSGQAVSLTGNGYDITIRGDGSYPNQDYGIEISGIDKDIRNYDVTALTSTSDVKIHNLSGYPLVLGTRSSGTTGESAGMISDLGTDNDVVFSAVSILNIEAEDYTDMLGVEEEATTDEEGGDNVTSIDTDDWMEYEITIPQSGTYSFDYRVSGITGGDFKVDLSNETVDEITFDGTGGDQIWETVRSPSPIHLTEGVNTFRITSNVVGWNLNWIQLLGECYETPILPYVMSVNALGTEENIYELSEAIVFPSTSVTLNPEPMVGGVWAWSGPNNFSSDAREVILSDVEMGDGGEFVATFINDCGLQFEEVFNIIVTESLLLEAEDYVEMEGVVSEPSTDTGDGENVTGINTGDWIELEVDVPFSADFLFDYRIASEIAGGFIVSSDDVELANVAFEATGGSQIWTTINSSTPIKLESGKHTVRITSITDGWDLNWINLNLDQLVSNCELPFATEDRIIQNETFDWSSGTIDISCVDFVNIYARVESVGTMDEFDSLNVYYKLDGGELIPVLETKGAYLEDILRVNELSGRNVELIIQGFTSSGSYNVTDIVMLNGSETSVQLEAEDNSQLSGPVVESSNDVNGGEALGFISDGTWCMFEDIELTGLTQLDARISCNTSGGTIEIREGSDSGTLLGSIPVVSTGGWSNWETVSSGDIVETTGIQDLYFVFKGETQFLFNVNWFQLTTDRDVKRSQEVWVTTLEVEKELGDEDYDPRAIASSGLTVTYTSSNLEVAIVVEGKISIVGVGETIITARSEGSGIYDAAENTQTLTVIESVLSSDETNLAVNVYPNPVSNYMNVRMNGNQYSSLVVYDITGTHVLSQRIIEGQELLGLNIESFSKGLYMVVLKGVQKNETFRIIKE